MRIWLTSTACLLVALAATFAVGYAPTQSRWGSAGIESMTAVGLLCFAAALAGSLPMGIVAPRWPSYLGQAVLGGTVLRLLITMGLSLGYQFFYEPHLPSFLLWAVVFYLVLLIVETVFGALAIRRFYVVPKAPSGASA